VLNGANYSGQSVPGDTGLTGSPCNDSMIDVKMTENNLPSYFPFVNPAHVNAQARVTIEALSAAKGSLPLAIPTPAPSDLKGYLVDEGNNNAVLAGPLTLTPDSTGTTWTSPTAAVTFSSAVKGPVGLWVDTGTGSGCGSQLNCYPTTRPPSLTYTRVWSSATGSNLPPQLDDATLAQASAGGCPLAPTGTFSNFVSSSSNCSVVVNAVLSGWKSGVACSNAQLTLTEGGTTIPISCPTGGPNGTWTSNAATVTPNSGATTFTLGWSLTTGTKPTGASGGDKNGNCTNAKPCTGSFGTVQRVFSGAYDSNSSSSSTSGPIVGATVADASTGSAIQSVTSGTQKNISVTVNVLNLGFANATSVVNGNPYVLHTSGNQGTYAIECGGNNGNPAFTSALATGCPDTYGTTTQPNPPICSNQPAGAAVCANQNPGNGKKVEPGINQRINNGGGTCLNPNHWDTQNTLGQILTQTPNDPRLVQLLVVDNTAWVGVTGSSYQTPIRQIAEFYITGWSRSGNGGDPCTSAGVSSSGLPYLADDDPASYGYSSGVLLGHFVKYVAPSASGTGGGPNDLCQQTSFGNCVAVLTK
jgi:hypothetical protein